MNDAKEERKGEEEDKLVMVAMQIILHAGDARTLAKRAMDKVAKFEFDAAYELLADADKEITLAHQSQTEVIQNEARGIHYEHSFIFSHAQDTLMTIMSELNLSKSLLSIAKAIMKQKQI